MISIDEWLMEAKREASAADCGMYLVHNGVARRTARQQAREGVSAGPVGGMLFSYDAEKLAEAVERAKAMPGIACVRVWLNEGRLSVGDDIMAVLVGGDIRPRVIACLEALVGDIKTNCVRETEVFADGTGPDGKTA